MLKKRVSDQKRYIKYGNKKSGLAKHAIENSHKFDLENINILERNIQNWGKRQALETYDIHKLKNNVNTQIESGFIDNIYIPII